MIPETRVNPQVVDLISRLHRQGFEAYIVGGAVRDLLLNLEPKDYDIVTSATPEEVRRLFKRQARIIGRRFRLVHVRYGSTVYEVSTFRREPTPEERRTRGSDDGVVLWSDNQYGNREQDARRRDFTVNALFYDPTDGGRMIDYVGGMADLEEGIVRMIGEPAVRLAEDPVRILRAQKLVAQYDFTLEHELAQTVREQGASIGLASRSRLYEELLKIFDKPFTVKTMAVFRENRFLCHFLPEVDRWWDESAGLLMRHLMAARDRRKAQGGYWKSRRLALATIALPLALQRLEVENPRDFIESPPEDAGKVVRNAIRELLEPLPIPKALSHDAKDVIMLLPAFFRKKQMNRVVRNPQYRWAHELFSLLVEVMEWPSEMLEGWPPADYGPPPLRSPGRGRSRGRRSGRRRGGESRPPEGRGDGATG